MLQSLPVTTDRSERMTRAFMEAAEPELRRRGAFSVRVYSFDSSMSEPVLAALGYDLASRWEFLIDLNRTLDEIWLGFAGERRTDIRKADKRGVTTRRENTSEALTTLDSFYSESMRRHGIATAVHDPQVALASKQRLESGKADLLVAYHGECPVSAALFVVFGGRAYYHVSGSSIAGYRCCAPAHVIWTAIRTYKEQGLEVLNLGAALDGQETLYKFKRDFGAVPVCAPMGTKRISRIGSALHWIRSLQRRDAGV
jgi:lipid II:glycine glycyltransferase (peptidoglycan interpeptide bridge formation enzyme)